jgi:pantoate--beta-alanine ligase
VELATTGGEVRELVQEWRREGDHVALVPPMGNLHDGHLSLVEAARGHAERVVVSIFVNPTQFEPGGDFDEYPRTLQMDQRKLQRANADLLFVPETETMYPFGTEDATLVIVPALSKDLCGRYRPGHFDGVTSVVARLFCIIQPDVAVFGQKDYQQQMIVRRMVADLGLPISIESAPTQRESDGLAQSSRNQYLTEDERRIAPLLYGTLQSIARDLQSGKRNYQKLEKNAVGALADAGFAPDYVAIRRAANLQAPDRDTDELVVLAAARLGKARLIDNVVVEV